MTAKQLRAARAMLRWPARELAVRAGVSLDTIRRAEAAQDVLPLHEASIRTIRHTLESAGIEFIESGIRIKDYG